MKLKTILNESDTRYTHIDDVDIKKFSDITDEIIELAVDDAARNGYSFIGYPNREMAIKGITELVNIWKKFPDPVTLYRVIGVVDRHTLKTEYLGRYWTFKLDILKDRKFLDAIGLEWHVATKRLKPYVIASDVPHSKIDIVGALSANLTYPHEYEIPIKNQGKGLKLVDMYELKL
jgi:hypothetical protein